MGCVRQVPVRCGRHSAYDFGPRAVAVRGRFALPDIKKDLVRDSNAYPFSYNGA
jgi:hypothetical protein